MSSRRLVVLGATGSVGQSTLDVVRRHPTRLSIHALSARRNVEGLLAACREFRPALVAIADASRAAELERGLRAAGLPTRVLAGPGAVSEIAAAPEADLVMAAIVGAAGLAPVLAAVRAGKRVLVANKEPLVMAGRLLLAEATAAGATLIPIDSEHNAIFQCLPDGSRCGTAVAGVRRLLLTASGGPFRDLPLKDLKSVTPEQAVQHPNWVMGPKISVDSATMMNKGLELIEAHYLFGMPSDRLEVVLHPQSVIHSLVEYVDGSTLAQLGQPDMRVPIAHALAAPERWESGVSGLSLADIGRLDFRPVDPARFPALAIARGALDAGGAMPNVLNAANEIAVEAFLDRRIGFTRIAGLIGQVLESAAGESLPAGETLAEILEIDHWARVCATAALDHPARAVGHA